MNRDQQAAVPNSSCTTATHRQEIGLGTIASHWKLLVAAVVISLGLGALYVVRSESVYEAEARILLEPEGQLAGELARDRRARDERVHLATQAEVLHSPALVRAAVARMPLPANVASSAHAETLAMRGLDVAALDEASILRLRFRSHDPEWTRGFLSALIDSYAADLADSERQRQGEMARLLSRREALLGEELDTARAEYAAVRRESPLVGHGADAARLQIDALRNLEQQLSHARSRRVDLESRLQAAAERDGGSEVAAGSRVDAIQVSARLPDHSSAAHAGEVPPIESAEPDAVTAMKPVPDPARAADDLAMSDPARIQQELSQARARADQAAERYGPKHPEMKSARAAVAFWQTRLENALAETTAASRQEIEALRIAERQLQADYEEAISAVRRLSDSLLTEQQHVDRIRHLEELQLATRARAVEAKSAAAALGAGNTGVLRVLEAPGENAAAVWPRPLHVLAACGIISLVGGLVLIGLTEQRRGREYPRTAGTFMASHPSS